MKPPIEPVGQSAFLIIRPNALYLQNSNRHAPSNFGFHKTVGAVNSPPVERNCRYGLGEFEGASGCKPPRQASPATPPQEGNCLSLRHGVFLSRNDALGQIYKSASTHVVYVAVLQDTTPSSKA